MNPEIDERKTKRWYNERRELHREDGPAVEYTYGRKEWWINGKLHRENGPVKEFGDGTKEWGLNGRLHREDGPAVEFADGGCLWYYHDEWIDCETNEEFLRIIKLRSFL